MDPNLFHLDWERLNELLVAIMVTAFLIERALSIRNFDSDLSF